MKWYALYTKSRFERRVFNGLQQQSIEAYLPMHKTLKQWSDRKKWVEEPLIKSYVFVKIKDEKEFFKALNVVGAVNFVIFSGKPASIPENQITLLRTILKENVSYEICHESFTTGDSVEVKEGSLAGLSGKLIEFKGSKKVLVEIDHIAHSLVLSIPSAYLRAS